MNKKRICAFMVSAAMAVGMIAVMPASEKMIYADTTLVSDDFEISYDGWTNMGDLTLLEASEGSAYDSLRGMCVTNRRSKNDGAYSEKGFYLEGGKDYDYSVYVRNDGKLKDTIRLTLRYLYPDGETYETVELASVNAIPNEWTELKANYKTPNNTVNLTLILTTDSTSDFSFDDVVVTEYAKLGINTVSAAASSVGLKDVYANYFRFGGCVGSGHLNNSTAMAIVLKDYNSVTCENEMKPDATMNQATSSGTNIGVRLNSAAAILDFCVKNNIAVRGHALVWHGQTPQWFFKENFVANGNYVSQSVMDQRMESYIKNIFALIKQQYPTLNLYAYDVVNEAVSDDANRTANHGGAREPRANDGTWADGRSPWVQIYGNNSFVEKAFIYARKYAPENCSLFYNDYNEYWTHKMNSIATMVESLYKKGVLDGMGMQSHIGSEMEGFTGIANFTTALNKYAAIGCEVQITELDVNKGDTGTDQQQAAKYKAVLQAAVNAKKAGSKITAVVIWGICDPNWVGNTTLYNSNGTAKEAYSSVVSVVPQSEWGDGDNIGNITIEPDANGYYFHDEFEDTNYDWTERGGTTLELSGRTPYMGINALLVSSRTASWNGAQKALSTSVFKPNIGYSFSACVKYLDGGNTETFHLTLQYTDANGETRYQKIDTKTAVKGEYVQLFNQNYIIPDGASNLYFYVETESSTTNFYIDEAIGAIAGTVIKGPAEINFRLGDLNSDGVINAIDLCLAQCGLAKGFSDNAMKISADINGDGNITAEDISYIKKFLHGQITEFPEILPVIDNAKMEVLFSSLTLSSSYKSEINNNPILTQKFGADPGVMVYNNRVYVYMTNDALEYDSNGNVKENSYAVTTINCLSSADLVNWTDHGSIPVAGSSGAAKWANLSWAPCAAHKTINGKEKFFLYFSNNAGGIGVLSADSPTGPWTDPLGKALISRSTPNCSDVTWLFDPAVLVDDDGTGYLYFGGGVPDGQSANPKTSRVVKLGNDMISLASDPATIDAPYHFEDSGINKIGNTYYYSYCTNWNTGGNTLGISNAVIAYMTSSSPMGPFTYGGVLFDNPNSFGVEMGGGGNNHHSLIQFKDEYYLFYHARAVDRLMGLGFNYRTTQVDKAEFSNGKLQPVRGTMTGVSQIETLNPYKTVQAETIWRQGGITIGGLGDTVVIADSGDWIAVKGAAFTQDTSSLTVRVSSASGGAIKICTGSETGKAVGYVEVPATGGSYTEIKVPVSGLSGTQNLYFVFSGSVNFDSWSFS